MNSELQPLEVVACYLAKYRQLYRNLASHGRVAEKS